MAPCRKTEKTEKSPALCCHPQAQSDSGGPEDLPAGFMMLDKCGIYKLVKEGLAPGGEAVNG